MVPLLLLLLLPTPHPTTACSRGPASKSVSVRHLAPDATLTLTQHQTLQRGELLYARFTVPPSSSPLAAVVTASWVTDYSTAPVWMFLRKGSLPARSSADWTDVFYRARRVSRVQVSEASPGTYYILLECRHHLEDLTLALTIGDATYLRRMEELKSGALDVQELEHTNEIDI